MKFILPVFSVVFLAFSANSQIQVLSEDFTTGIPATWTIRIADTNHVADEVLEYTPGWIGITDPLDATNQIAAATSFFRTPGIANRWLITPSVQLGAFGNILKWRARSHDPSFAEDYRILISTTDNEIASFTDTVSTVFLEFEDWTEHEVNLSEQGYNSQNIYIAFVLKTYDGFKFYLDDVNLRKDDPVSVDENIASSISLYPNPATTSFSIKGDASLVKLISLTGEVILYKEITENKVIDISALNAGTYIVEIVTKGGIFRKKIIKN